MNGDKLGVWQGAPACAGACHSCVGLGDVDPIEVLDRWIKYRVAERAFVFWMAVDLADLTIVEPFIVFVEVVCNIGVDLNGVVGGIGFLANAGITPGTNTC